MKVLLTGSSGQLGREIINLKPTGINLIKPNRFCLDLSNSKSCQKYRKTEFRDQKFCKKNFGTSKNQMLQIV